MPEEMRLGRAPDLLYVPGQFLDTVQEFYVNSHGVTLVVELCDHRTRAQVFGRRLDDYALAGIPEVWVLDTERRTATFFVLRQRKFARIELAPGDAFQTRAWPRFKITYDQIWGP